MHQLPLSLGLTNEEEVTILDFGEQTEFFAGLFKNKHEEEKRSDSLKFVSLATTTTLCLHRQDTTKTMG